MTVRRPPPSRQIQGDWWAFQRRSFRAYTGEKIFATLVRDPVRRAASYYHYITEMDPTHPERDRLRSLGFEGAVSVHAWFIDQISNYQCTVIAGRADANLAIERLADWLVDTTDNAERLVSSACALLGLTAPARSKRHNVAKQGYFHRIATPDAIRMIEDLNVEDQRLLRFVESRAGMHSDSGS